MNKAGGFLQEFLEFVRKFGVIGIAIGIVAGNAATAFVGVLSANLLTPIVTWVVNLFGKGAFNALNVTVGSGADAYVFGFGNIIEGLINFLAVLAVIFLIVKLVVNRFMTEDEKKKV